MTDFQFFDHGSITILKPVSAPAHDWVEQHLPDDAQSFAGGVVIEPRYAEPILDGIAADDLTITFH